MSKITWVTPSGNGRGVSKFEQYDSESCIFVSHGGEVILNKRILSLLKNPDRVIVGFDDSGCGVIGASVNGEGYKVQTNKNQVRSGMGRVSCKTFTSIVNLTAPAKKARVIRCFLDGAVVKFNLSQSPEFV